MSRQQRLKEFEDYINRRLEIFKGFILTGLNPAEKDELTDRLMDQNPEMVMIKDIESPKALFYSLKELNGMQVLIADEILHKRKEWIRLIEQAVCSSPDSSDSWEVDYLNECCFKFTGELIILTKTPNDIFVKNKKYTYLNRDCFVL